MKLLRLIPLALVCAGLIGCSSDNPTKPGDASSNLIAGGGRQTSGDPFIGGPDESGPMSPDSVLIPPDSIIYEGLIPLFYSDRDCAEAPGQRVIRTEVEWQAWWAAATECLGSLGQGTIGPDGMHDEMYEGGHGGMYGHMGDSIPGDSGIVWPDSGIVWPDSGIVWPDSGIVWPDSGIVWPDTVINPWPPEQAPPVDFDQFAVVVISLESDTLVGRSLWVTEVTDNSGGAVVKYQVTQLGDDCLMMLERISLWYDNSPTVAVQVPLPLSEPVSWERSDEIINCTSQPNLKSPWTIYYTDANCDLGPGEEIIRDQGSFDAWIEAAMACDSARWNHYVDSTFTWTDSMGEVIEPHPTRPVWWWAPEIDFSTHAVIILRAGEQTSWGGGVWLNDYDGSGNRTVVEYTVMEPGADCPAVETEPAINPTVAIRVPLPAGNPVSWTRHTETLNCDWPDTVFIEPGHGGGR